MRKPAKTSKPVQTKAATPVLSRSRFPSWLLAVLLMLVTIALYWPAMRCDFINYDDPVYVTENPHVQGGLSRAGDEVGVYRYRARLPMGTTNVGIA
jgi:hypothetical protein